MSESKNTLDGRPRDEIRAVRMMVDELRAQPAPEFAWDAMEQRLLTRIAERSAVALLRRPAPPPSMFGRVVGFAVAAAAIAFGVASAGSSSSLPSRASDAAGASARRTVDVATIAWASGPSEGTPAHELAALRVGDVVEARQAPVSFAEAGLVKWTLEPGSVLRVRSVGLPSTSRGSVGVGHTVELERGSLRAEVTPRDPSEGMVEAFAVEVGGTRVAVHGTAFSVQVENGRVVVDVEHGAVAVGPVGYAGTTTGHLLVGPSRGAFSLDGGRVARLLDRPSVSQPAVASRGAIEANPGAGSGEAPAAGADPRADDASAKHSDATARADRAVTSGRPAPGAKNPSGEAADVARLTADIVRGRLDRCFRRAFDAAPSALESVSSTLAIDLNPDGTVRAARFNPPLNGPMTSCAGGAIAGRFADDAGHVEIPIAFHP